MVFIFWGGNGEARGHQKDDVISQQKPGMSSTENDHIDVSCSLGQSDDVEQEFPPRSWL